jgi:hypothetical protein
MMMAYRPAIEAFEGAEVPNLRFLLVGKGVGRGVVQLREENGERMLGSRWSLSWTRR